MLNTLFFLEPNPERNGEYVVEIYRLHRYLFLVQTLAMFGGRSTAVWLAKKSLKLARSSQHTVGEIQLLDFLRRHFALTGKARLHDKYSELVNRKMALLHAEQLTSTMNQSLRMEYVRTGVPRVSLVEKTAEYYDIAKQLADKHRTYSVVLESIRIGILYNQVIGENQETLKLCNEAEGYFKAHPKLTPAARYGELELQRLESYLYLRDYEQGSIAAQRCEGYFVVGRNNWFVYMEYYFLLAMHTLRFERATEIFEQVTSHPRFSVQQEPIREKWHVFELCLNYANRVDRPEKVKGRAIDVDNLLGTVPIYSKDKQGYNVPILVMHILLLLERGDLDAIMQRMEALKSYRSRYLRAKTNRHSALFFKLLTIMEMSGFDYEKIKRKGAKYYEQLQTSPSAYTEVHEGVQILSYAWLWERVLERLEHMNATVVIAR
ncbi:MAG TPA: hypothetical protein VFH43_04505 [Candidatus Kapabacteria bacterium]|nr:hypothetical protein [Candidatus Kapabacteria bacterium]